MLVTNRSATLSCNYVAATERSANITTPLRTRYSSDTCTSIDIPPNRQCLRERLPSTNRSALTAFYNRSRLLLSPRPA